MSAMPVMDLRGKLVLVTGAMGAERARVFVAAGAAVVLVSRRSIGASRPT